jgi:hypothetical protein
LLLLLLLLPAASAAASFCTIEAYMNASGWATWLTTAVDTRVIAGQMQHPTAHTQTHSHRDRLSQALHHSYFSIAHITPLHHESHCPTAAPIVFDALDFMQFLHRMWRR